MCKLGDYRMFYVFCQGKYLYRGKWSMYKCHYKMNAVKEDEQEENHSSANF